MSVRSGVKQRLWITRASGLGVEVDHNLVEAAHRVWESARFLVLRILAEETEAAEILEHVVEGASRAQNGNRSIHHLDTYLLRSVAREALRRRRRRDRFVLIDPADLDRLRAAPVQDMDRKLDEGRWIDLLRASLDPRGRELLNYRLLDYRWTEIASAMGYANGHSAEVQFQKSVARALKRIEVTQNRRRACAKAGSYED